MVMVVLPSWTSSGSATRATSLLGDEHYKERPRPGIIQTPASRSSPAPTPTPSSAPTRTSGRTPPPAPTVCSGVALSPSSDLQAAINGAPSGTTFCLASGTYHPSSLAPKSGDVVDGGNRQAVWDGQGTLTYAVHSSSASNVTLRGLVIQNYNNPAQSGAIQSFGSSGWVLANNDINHNHGVGVAVDGGAQVLNNHLWYNHQEGYACHGNHDLFQGNEIDHNNWLMEYSPGWEAGGGKCWATQYLTFRDNYSHDNGGPGLWTDTDNVYTTYDSNTVKNNWGAGIFHEISYAATISNNNVSGNGFGESNGWLWDAGIQISSSGGQSAATPIAIYGNTVTNNYNGIGLLQQNRGSGALGTYLVQNVNVHDNTVTMSRGGTGVVQDDSDNGVWTRNVTFVHDSYTVSNHSGMWFAWAGDYLGWPAWRVLGLDATGSLT